jgi:hypothetical protein
MAWRRMCRLGFPETVTIPPADQRKSNHVVARVMCELVSGSGVRRRPSRQILLRLPQPIDRPLDPLADGPPVEILRPAKPLAA